ncbi:MAG TPA: hypothetical protein EYO33_10585 [Phycisphaerales bacterium]|nr:hypothetical protein [Phycisphaerales bacterium]
MIPACSASADFYIIFVQSRRLKTNELSSGLKWLSLKNKLESLSLNKKSTTGIEAMIALEEALVRRASFSSGFRCRTDSNLSSKVFEEIVTSIGIDYEPYATKANFIDKELLERRNQIAHGERLDLLAGDYIKLKDNVLSLMRELKTDIENHCASKLFKVEP